MTITVENITPTQLEELLGDEGTPVVHRALWALLWESEVRVHDLLSLEVTDVGLDEREMRTVAARFSERAGALLAELVGDRETGPLFAVGERALTWEEAVRAAGDREIAIHAFRTGGKSHRRGLGG
ncbi:hypothetical protein [Streptomyces hainanensis]|uniref:Tyr recombinase domain-containing protein n=1 Tax=Streptomyces hainanensis TaxID=402648 RepID=A0A4R4TGZ5_9ACTN|nr:hypothetical protein [Streptomyces hainanensis]TDC77028.1 hypothetical protein E1283_08350 [Streptomyces hainanensis]